MEIMLHVQTVLRVVLVDFSKSQRQDSPIVKIRRAGFSEMLLFVIDVVLCGS
jgi:hypothetical protein